jgi:hypothetical protein
MIEALKAAYLAGFNASGEGYNGEYPYGDLNLNPEDDAVWHKNRDNKLQAIQQEQANIQTQITKDNLRPVKTYSGGKAWPVQMQWVGLTTDDIQQLEKENTVGGYYADYYGDYCPTWGLIQSVEAELKEKNSNGQP